MVALVALKSTLALRADDSAFISKLHLQTHKRCIVRNIFKTMYTNVMTLLYIASKAVDNKSIQS